MIQAVGCIETQSQWLHLERLPRCGALVQLPAQAVAKLAKHELQHHVFHHTSTLVNNAIGPVCGHSLQAAGPSLGDGHDRLRMVGNPRG